MLILLDSENIALLSVMLLNFTLGLVIFIYGRNKRVNRFYALNIVAIIGWMLAMFFYRSASQEAAFFWCTVLYIVPTFIASSFLYFTYIFPSQIEKVLWWRILLIVIFNIIIVSLVAIPGAILRSVNIVIGQEREIMFGSFYPLYILYILSHFLYGFFRLFKKWHKSFGTERSQVVYLLTGYSLAANISFVTNLLMPWFGYFFLNWLGQVSAIFMVGFTAYAIVVHRLMDIKLVMRKYSVYLASLSSIIILAIGLKYVFDRYIPLYTDWADFFILIGGVSVFPEIKSRFYRLANKYFFSSLYDARQVIAELSDKLRSTLDVENIYDYITEILTSAFHVKALGILIYDEKGAEYLVAHNNGFKLNGNKSFANNRELHRLFIAKNEPIILDELKENTKPAYKDTVDLLLKLKVAVLMPLNIKDKTIGLIALGQKESGDMYNDEDLQVMKVAGAQAAIAMENALLYDESKKFGSRLEKEVEKATRDLRKANVQLKRLDQAKSDFISIASHQLRTPLTVIKGYISMILEGDFGALTEPEHESLEKIYESNERLINLVENLLNISRIESGRLKFDFKQVDLDQMAASVAEELSGNAKKKNLLLEYRPPAKPLPKLKLDEEKIRQVVMNLIDNAIKYTKQGRVAVKLEQSGDKIKFCVADTGMGIKPEDMGNLFKKFSRGDGTSLIHTEGTGLGLYVAKMMIEAHHGRIWAESDGVGKGSRFCFELPVK